MKLRKILSLILTTIIFIVLTTNIIQNWSVIKSLPWHFNGINAVLLLLFLCPIYLINSSSWFLVLRALGNRIGYLQSIRIWLLSNASRFIPGVVWQYGGRIYLSSNAGVPTGTTFTALLVELVFLMTVVLIIILTTFSFWNYSADIKFFQIAALILPIFITLILFFNNQRVITKVASIYKMITGKESEVKSFKLSIYWIGILLVSYSFQFIFAGSVLFLLTKLTVNLDWSLYPIFIGIFAASWLLGYVTMIAPAGLGVQEISIATMLSFYMPFPVASVIAILFRLMLLLTEAITILFVSMIFKRRRTT